MKKSVFGGIFLMLTLGVMATLFSDAFAETKYVKKEDIKDTMAGFTKALGVKCDFCHIKDRRQTYESLGGEAVDKEVLITLVRQRIARSMLGSMLLLIQKEGKLYTCNTCHQGKAEPGPEVK